MIDFAWNYTPTKLNLLDAKWINVNGTCEKAPA